MAVLKTIAGHGSTTPVQDYLEGAKGERVLACDLVNVAEINGQDHRTWSEQMDHTRHLFENDMPINHRDPKTGAMLARPARTYQHYVISPDPRDKCSLETLRAVTMEWVREFFSDYEVAVVYHDDNDAHIVHAHVVVNNTNLETHKRISPTLTKTKVRTMTNHLQNISLEHGLSGFTSDSVSMNEREMALLGKNVDTRGEPDPRWHDHTGQEARTSKGIGAVTIPKMRPDSVARAKLKDNAQEGIDSRGQISWKTQILECVEIARTISLNETQFVVALKRMGVTITETKNGDDWLFHHPDGGAKQVRGQRLGRAYTKSAIRRGFSMGYASWTQRATGVRTAPLPPMTKEQRKAISEAVHVVAFTTDRTDITTKDISALLDYNARHQITSYEGYESNAEGRRMAKLARELHIYDEGKLERRTRTAQTDVNLVAQWMLDERDAKGQGGLGVNVREVRGSTSTPNKSQDAGESHAQEHSHER